MTSTVTFGNAAASFTYVSGTQLTAISPPGTGIADVQVTTAGQTSARSASDQFSYGTSTGPTVTGPTVTSISPASGPAGTSVNVNGTGFTATSTVTFGGVAAASVTLVSNIQLTATAPANPETAGSIPVVVDVQVTSAGQTSVPSAGDRFTYQTSTGLIVTSISPASGTAGTNVTVNGAGFTAGSTVKFGSVAATNVNVVGTTQFTATAPAGTGTVDVLVTTAGQTSARSANDQFSYVTGTGPNVTSISPTSGPPGTSVTITGTGFTAASKVTFAGVAATGVSVVNSTQITATAPAGTGLVDVQVTVARVASSKSAADQFTYAVPTVTSISPATGPATGGTAVTINGTGFSSASKVQFGTMRATKVAFVSATQLTATSPAGIGVVDVQVSTAGLTSSTTAGDQFTYASTGPTVTGIDPASGPAGTTVTITGTNFTNKTTVKFGNLTATPVTFVNDTTLKVPAPASKGTVDVQVTAAGQVSATSAADQFTYTAPTVTSIAPTTGPGTGGTLVTISGTGFAATSTVKFGTTAATKVTFVNAARLTATSPAGSGVVDVQVTTAGTTSDVSNNDQFTYTSPTVTSISPASGPTGRMVTIKGTGFTQTSTVAFAPWRPPP